MEIFRNIWRRKLRSTLTISGIVIGVFALTTFGAFAENFNALIDGGVQYFGGSVQVGPPDGQAANLLPMSKIDEIKSVEGVEAAFAGYQFQAKPGGAFVVSFGVPDTIVAADPGEDAYSALKLTYASGRAVSTTSRGDVALGYTIAKEFKKKVGDTIDLPVRPADAKPDFINHTFNVVGLISETKTAPDSFAYINLADGQMLLRDSLPAQLRDSIDVTQITEGISVYGKHGTSLSELDKIADRINSEVPGVKALRPSDLVNAFRAGGQIFTGAAVAAALLALVVGGLSIINTMFMAVSDRVREIGLKKAVGATTTNILREFLVEATFMGLLGGLIGYGLGVLLVVVRNVFFPAADGSSLFLITPMLTGIAIGFAAVLGALAGVFPALRAARLDPVIALRND
ncbi:MAG: ABC transporter permease [Chloroflexi bacterium]|nr:MAG: ABC transporter permease [Chloroflexota bacterium]